MIHCVSVCMCDIIRIVKMSSPNLNVLTLFGSVLTYSSGFLFAIDERTHLQGAASTTVLQVSTSINLNSPLYFWINRCWIIL